jgi:hypothetical protein
MRNKKVVRFQLFVLAALTIGLVARVMIGPGSPEGLVVMSNFDSSPLGVSKAVAKLEHASFSLDSAEPFVVEATGSIEEKFDPSRPVPALAAYPWILDRSSRNVVWKMEPTNVQIEKTTLARSTSTVTLGPGAYDVYFTTYGNTRSSREAGNLFKSLLGTHWTADVAEWSFVLSSGLEEGSTRFVAVTEDDASSVPLEKRVFWSTGPLRNQAKSELVFQVSDDLSLRLYSVGEICRRNECDYGWIEEAFSGDRVWELNEANSEAAGGMAENRQCRQVLSLEAGLYRAVFKTDGAHAYDDWIANPPFDPSGWGLTLYLNDDADASSIAAFDPWKSATPMVRISGVGNDEHRQLQFVVSDTVGVVMHAAGELRRSGNLYDYGWLRNDSNDEKVWEMSWAASYPGGGHKGNREETAFIRLVPGTYSLYYQTDDSHSFGKWSNGTPDHPDRWGVAMFPFGGSESIRVIESKADTGPAKMMAPPPPVSPGQGPATGTVLLDARSLGNEQEVKHAFTIDKTTRLRVVAVGEISMNGRYDYGWLETSDGTAVWEMNYTDTAPAGGDDRNRKFDGVIELQPGTYVVRFKTDFSHAFGDFGDDAPTDPSAWGIVVRVLDWKQSAR